MSRRSCLLSSQRFNGCRVDDSFSHFFCFCCGDVGIWIEWSAKLILRGYLDDSQMDFNDDDGGEIHHLTTSSFFSMLCTQIEKMSFIPSSSQQQDGSSHITEAIHCVCCYPWNDVNFDRNFILYGGENTVYLSTYRLETKKTSEIWYVDDEMDCPYGFSDVSKPLFQESTHGNRIVKLAFAPLQNTDYKLTFATIDNMNTIRVYRVEKPIHTTSTQKYRFGLIANISNVHSSPINSVCFLQNNMDGIEGLNLVTVSDDHRCVLTTISSSEQNKYFTKVIYDSPSSALVSVNVRNINEIVVGQQYPGTLQVLDFRTLSSKLKPVVSLKSNKIGSLYDSDVHTLRNEWIGAAIGKDFCIFDCRQASDTDSSILHQQEAHPSNVCKRFRWAPTQNPSQQLFATTNQYDTVKIWDTTNCAIDQSSSPFSEKQQSANFTFKQNYRIGGISWTNSIHLPLTETSIRKLPCLMAGGDRKLHCYCLQ